MWLENAEDDQKAVKTAVKVWNKIVKEIDSIPLEVKETPALRSKRVSSLKGLAFDLGAIFPEFRGLIVFFCGGISSAAAYSKPTNTIFIKILDENSQFKDDGRSEKQTTRSRIKYWSKEKGRSFVHEFIHYLDSQRGGMVWPENPPRGDDEDEGSYFNSPLEFNAFYQELVANINRSAKKEDFMRPFGEFLKMATRKMSEYPRRQSSPIYGHRPIGEPSEKWIDKLNPTYRQKFIKRLYGYYMMRKSKYDGLAEQSSMVRRTWPNIFSSMEDEPGPNSKENLETLEKMRRMRIAQNAQGTNDHSARIKHLPNWFHTPDGKIFEYDTPEGNYTIRKGEGGMLLGGDWLLTSPDGEDLGYHPTPEAAAEQAGADWADNFNQD